MTATPHRPEVSGEVPLEVWHITRECRADGHVYSAWFDAISPLRDVYLAQIERDPEATISVAIYRTSPET